MHHFARNKHNVSRPQMTIRSHHLTTGRMQFSFFTPFWGQMIFIWPNSNTMTNWSDVFRTSFLVSCICFWTVRIVGYSTIPSWVPSMRGHEPFFVQFFIVNSTSSTVLYLRIPELDAVRSEGVGHYSLKCDVVTA